MIKLKIRIPGEAESEVTVDGHEAMIGRNPECEVSIPMQSVSGVHARLLVGVVVEDRESTNGVWVDGQRLDRPTLLKNAPFRLGSLPDASAEVEVVETSLGGRRYVELADRLQDRNDTLRQRVQELEVRVRELEDERRELGTEAFDEPETSEPAAEEDPDARGGEEQTPYVDFASFFLPPSAEPRAPGAKSGRKRVLELIDRLVKRDVKSEERLLQAPVEEFFIVESFRLLRMIETLVTRLAREFRDLRDDKTELPERAGNFRSLTADVLAFPDDRMARQRLVDYLDELGRWLGVSVTAYRRAAFRFAEELKRDLTPEGLTREAEDDESVGGAIPAWVKCLGREGAEYWRRAQAYLRDLDREHAEERIDALAAMYADREMERFRGKGE